MRSMRFLGKLAMHGSIHEIKVTLLRLLRLRQRDAARGHPRLAVNTKVIDDEGLRRLMAEGTLSWNGGKPQPKPPARLSSKPSSPSSLTVPSASSGMGLTMQSAVASAICGALACALVR